jgi:hypothetical protein
VTKAIRIPADKRPEPRFYVAYVDILGFRRLVMGNKMPRARSLDHKRRAGWWRRDAMYDMYNPVGKAFTSFHACFDRAVDKTDWESEATMMVFSDSVFVGTTDAASCMSFCEILMRYCIEADVPVRTGVGYGTFVTHGFSFESNPRLKIVTTQFFGSAVIRAVDAEKVLKGTRIALHPRTAKVLKEKHVEQDDKLIELPAGVATKCASHEWSLLSSAGEMGGIDDPDFVDQDGRLLKHLTRMMDESPATFKHYYTGSIEAVDRMVKLRDRWIPGEDDDPDGGADML